jgi:predicted nucleic-acid-binding protein
MIGIDTNCLLRYALRDDARQHRAVEARIEDAIDAGDNILINDIVLAEFVWVLGSNYGFGREMLAGAITGLLEGQQFAFEQKEIVMQALRDFERGKAGFADCLIGQKNRRHGCNATLTFDRAAAKLETFEHV